MIRRTVPFVLLLAAQWLAVAAALAADVEQKRYALPGHGALQMSMPAGWSGEVGKAPQGMPPTIAFHGAQGKSFEVLVTPIWRARADAPPVSKGSIRQNVERALEG